LGKIGPHLIPTSGHTEGESLYRGSELKSGHKILDYKILNKNIVFEKANI